MARTASEIVKDIEEIRRRNRELYERLEVLALTPDKTLERVILAYARHPDLARDIHQAIVDNDALIMGLSRELIGCE